MTQRGCPDGPLTQATFAADTGKGATLGLKALGGTMATGQLQGPTKESGEKKKKTRYTDDDIAAIMGFSGGIMFSQSGPPSTMLNRRTLAFSVTNC